MVRVVACHAGDRGSNPVGPEDFSPWNNYITKTSQCNEHPLTPHFYIVKLGFTGELFIFLFLLQNIDCGYSLEPPQ